MSGDFEVLRVASEVVVEIAVDAAALIPVILVVVEGCRSFGREPQGAVRIDQRALRDFARDGDSVVKSVWELGGDVVADADEL